MANFSISTDLRLSNSFEDPNPRPTTWDGTGPRVLKRRAAFVMFDICFEDDGLVE